MINGILDLSKIEAGKMLLSLETFQVKTMIGGLVDTVRPLVEKNRNTLTVRGTDQVRPMHADLTKTRQILLNLLSNASKFTHDGTITVDIRECTIDGAEAIEFSVTDSGVGMTVEQTQKVFDPFTQADVTTTRKYGGTGLGLAIVSRFCDLMGGSVSVESRPGEGSRFVVRLPREAREAATSRWCPPAWGPATSGNDGDQWRRSWWWKTTRRAVMPWHAGCNDAGTTWSWPWTASRPCRWHYPRNPISS